MRLENDGSVTVLQCLSRRLDSEDPSIRVIGLQHPTDTVGTIVAMKINRVLDAQRHSRLLSLTEDRVRLRPGANDPRTVSTSPRIRIYDGTPRGSLLRDTSS